MIEDLSEAAAIAGVGVLVVMAALAILMVAIALITRLAPGGKKGNEATVPEDIPEEVLSRKQIAAIAVAMALATRENGTSPAVSIQPAPPGNTASRWAFAGRERLMRARGRPGGK